MTPCGTLPSGCVLLAVHAAVSLRSETKPGSWDDVGWLETEWSEGSIHEARRPERIGRRSCLLKCGPKNRRSGVRGPIVARNPANVGGAKGTRKMDAA